MTIRLFQSRVGDDGARCDLTTNVHSMASSHERFLYAAKNDDISILKEVLASKTAGFSPNVQDGLGNTGAFFPLHQQES
jgi:hypothetical protein